MAREVAAEEEARRFGRAAGMLSVGVGALFVSTLGLPLAGGVAAIAALRFLNGVGWSSVTANASTLASEMSPPHRRGEALGLYGMAQSVALAAVTLPRHLRRRYT